MFTQFITIGLLMLLAVMLPGPDFAMVTKNTILHSRRAGFFTSLGIGCSNLVHITYCILGLAIVISKSLLLFSLIKYVGAAYMIYLGVKSLLSKKTNQKTEAVTTTNRNKDVSDFAAFSQGFLCNILNPKATLFFLSLFTIILPGTKGLLGFAYALEMFIIITAWFFLLTLILSQARILNLLNKAEIVISRLLGVFLIGFGVMLAFTDLARKS